MNLPNTITVARVALVPVFVLLAYGDTTGAAVSAFAVFITASLSDSLDGWLARRSGTVTRAGQFLDPLADKLLVGAALVVLVDVHAFPLWAAVLIGVREVVVQVFRTRIVARGGTLPASGLGKAKTLLQVCMVGWWLLPWDGRNAMHWVWLAAALMVTLWSGYLYVTRSGDPSRPMAPLP